MSRLGGVILAAMAMAATIPAVWAQAPANPQAQENVRQSEQYQHLVCTNPGFRASRIAKECGPLQGSQFYESCVASFNCGNQAPLHPRAVPPSERIR